MSRYRYAVFPGNVVSQTDGDIHFVNSTELMRLYQVKPDECLVVFSDNDRRLWAAMPAAERDALIKLKPRYDGDYPIFQTTKA